MRSPAAINLVLLAGGTTLFGAAGIAQHNQHQRACQEMRDRGIPDTNNQCSPGRGGGYGGHGGYGARGWGTYATQTGVSRGGFGSTGARFGGFGFHGFG
jgi:hypothetical protein